MLLPLNRKTHAIFSWLSCSCIAMAIIQSTSYGLSPRLLSRISPTWDQFKEPSNAIFNRHFVVSNTKLYSTNPTGRKRRRRKDSTDDDDIDNVASNDTSSTDDVDVIRATATSGGNELPDFDIIDDDELAATSSSPTKTAKKSTSPSTPIVVDPLIGTITPNMMASSPSTSRVDTTTVVSVNDLRDRSLEQKLEALYTEPSVEGQGNEPLPDLLTLQRQRKKITTEDILLSSSSSLSKKERQTLARQQQDMEQQSKKASMMQDQDVNNNENLFSKLPFITDATGKVQPLKLLEAATWTCIIALALWEVYINSPFFDRAAPIIPIVYELWI